MKNISVVIVSWNSQKTIFSCLNSLVKHLSYGLIKEIMVVDNFSQDGTCRVIEERFSQVKLIKNRQNLGFGKANNQALKKVTGEYVFLLNPDAFIKGNSLKKMVSVMDKNPQIVVVGPKLLYESGKLQKEMTPFPVLLPQILILLRFHRLPFFSSLVYPNYNYEIMREAQHLMGAALLIRTKVLKEVNGFNENFFMWFEEADLLKRISQLGYKIIYYPQAVVFHKIGESTRRVSPLKRQLIWSRSLLYYFKKHHGWFKMSLLLPFVGLGFLPAVWSSIRKDKNKV